MYIHWFNPENDLALAAGVANYTPPRAARLIHDDGAVLPLWYGHDGDLVLCYGLNDDWYTQMAEDFGLTTDVFDHVVTPYCEPAPWGWSAYARRFFTTEGFPPESLPTDEQIDMMRVLSHRRTSALIARRLAEMLPDAPLTPAAVEVDNEDTLAEMLQGDADLVLKAPWSSSGRGVVYTKEAGYDKALRQGADAIRRQGSVMAEQRYDKVLDFARLYECRDGECTDLGTSVFSTDAHGAYTGNLLAPEDERVEQVYKHFPADTFKQVVTALREIIKSEIAPYYTGIVGVDMLITVDGRLDPVVEVNLRTTMGYVANVFTEKYLHPDSRGTFAVTPITPDSPALPDHYTAADRRLISGTLNLTPTPANFAFTVTAQTTHHNEL